MSLVSYVDWSFYLVPSAVVLGVNAVFFLWCQSKKDNSHIDAMWGLTFMFPNLALLIKRSLQPQSPDPDTRCVITLALVSLWGIRLCYHIARRHKEEDWRYVDMRKRWMDKGGYTGYLWRAFTFVFMMQGAFSLVVNSAALYVAIYSTGTPLTTLDLVGIAVWTVGFTFECVGDYQLTNHLASAQPGKKKFINSGLWLWTRHPNYFGEAVLWWGIWIIACSVEGGWKTAFAPAFITYLVRYLSGVPLLEKKYKGNPEWEAYCDRVNVFLPWFPRSSKKNI